MALSNEQWNAPSGGGDFYDYQIASSLRGSFAQNSYLHRVAGTPTSTKTMTMSYWVKKYRTTSTTGSQQVIFVAGTGGAAYMFWQFKPHFAAEFTGGSNVDDRLTTTAAFQDTSAWYHHVLRIDSTQATATNRVRLYVNGVEGTYSNQNVQSGLAHNEVVSFLNADGVRQSFGGYSGLGHGTTGADLQMAEIVFIDGLSLGPDSFGETKNGVWKPIDPSGLTFGDNGYHLKMLAGAIGDDSSGNDNDFTVANFAAHDVLLDSPTFGDSSGGNFCTLNPLNPTTNGAVYTEGNLKVSPASNWSTTTYIKGTMHIPRDKKIYFEASDAGSNGGLFAVGIARESGVPSGTNVGGAGSVTIYDDSKYVNGTQTSSFVTQASTGDIIQVAVDGSNGKVWLGINNTWAGSGDPAAGSNEAGIVTSFATEQLFPVVAQNSASNLVMNFGQDSSFAGAKTAQGNGGDNEDFTYTPPTDFVALSTANLTVAEEVDPAETNDDFPQKLFNTVLHTGSGAEKAIAVGFQPDWSWIKERGAAGDHKLTDSSRGVTKSLEINTTTAEATEAQGVKAFTSTGITLGTDAAYNNNTDTYVSWNWRVNGGSLTTNDVGNQTSYTQTDPSGAFSIVKYAATGNAMTIGHGLSVKPILQLIKDRDAAVNWMIYTQQVDGSQDYLFLNTNAAAADSGLTGPNSSIWNWQSGSSFSNTSGRNYIMYNFANVDGYCKVGKYEGNGNADGAFVYTGFSPAWIMIKSVDSTSDWQMFDNKRLGYNVDNNEIQSNESDAEATTDMIDILSNGFKCRIATDPNVAETYIYLAFAHNPFKYATAR